MPLSPPILYTRTSLLAHPTILTSLRNFINKSFHTSHLREPENWDPDINRFTDEDEVLDMLVEEGVMCLIFSVPESGTEVAKTVGSKVRGEEDGVEGDSREAGELEELEEMGEIVACGGAIPWTSAKWTSSGSGEESDSRKATEKSKESVVLDWEVKTVCASTDPRFSRTGLAVKVVDSVQDFLRKKVVESRRALGRELWETTVRAGDVLTLWVVTVESLVGAYWLRRGYVEVGRKTARPGTWGCKRGFEMLLLKKEVGLQ
ncbi:hypothetical protein M011DRAFT_471073 [Sporormia fimetaria CBS 119925]|uniref:N-acetyltransferase domain-containing protein n=1 Tax=Sporormia fimetaria CBS 119925 TaxID=1340428 RepID=A0A6A6V1C4_9PLEO|nr:hypothetical protein M011DRAFT_471073 [Sporormia fimetaria CBS 119925]